MCRNALAGSPEQPPAIRQGPKAPHWDGVRHCARLGSPRTRHNLPRELTESIGTTAASYLHPPHLSHAHLTTT